MSRLIYLTGPVRSGKAGVRLNSASGWGEYVVFVATYRVSADDAEMAARVSRHRAERPDWRTLEAPRDVIAALAGLPFAPGGVVLDCLTLWLGDRMEQDDAEIVAEWDKLLAFAGAAPWPMIVVGNELGWGLVPETPEARRFRDLVGTLAQRTAVAADEAWLLVAGCPLKLK